MPDIGRATARSAVHRGSVEKGVAHPGLTALAIESDDIEPARSTPAVVHQIVLGGQRQAPAFARVYARQRPAKAAAAAEAYLDEHQAIAVTHYQIDLAGTAAIVAGNRLKSVRDKLRLGPVFGDQFEGAPQAAVTPPAQDLGRAGIHGQDAVCVLDLQPRPQRAGDAAGAGPADGTITLDVTAVNDAPTAAAGSV